MSSGSYQYMYAQDVSAPWHDELKAMAVRLRALGHSCAAEWVRQAAWHLSEAQEIVEDMVDVVQAVEWLDSGDWDKGSVDEAVQRWQTKREKREDALDAIAKEESEEG